MMIRMGGRDCAARCTHTKRAVAAFFDSLRTSGAANVAHRALFSPFAAFCRLFLSSRVAVVVFGRASKDKKKICYHQV